ncbi:FecR family protein [Dyadobacter frigoris]|nr:FecR family protein [Dyadobacter frigoris]
MNSEEAKLLLQRYRMGLCSDSEKKAVEAWFDTLASQQEVNWTELEKMQFGDSLRSNVMKAVRQDAPVVSAGKNKVFPFLRYASAAIILFTIGLGAYFLVLQKREPSAVSVKMQPDKEDIAPGRDGAILTLADGRQILLDSAGNGNLAMEGSTVIRNNNGQIQYDGQGALASENLYNTMTTPKGRQYALILSDGTRVWLNAGSSITYPTVFKKNDRRVTITGEAYLEVAHLPDVTQNASERNIPFTVLVGDLEIKVLGTRFNINAYPDEASIKTTLLEGSVQLMKNGKTSLLSPGQQAIISGNSTMKVYSGANLDEALAWRNGLFTFDDADIETVMRQLARWYDMEVYFEGEIPTETFWGDLQRNANLSSVLKVLEKSGVKFTIDGKKVRVLQVLPPPR